MANTRSVGSDAPKNSFLPTSEFELYVKELCESAGFSVQVPEKYAQFGGGKYFCDYIMEKEKQIYVVEIKGYRSPTIDTSVLKDAALKLLSYKTIYPNAHFVIIVPSLLSNKETSIEIDEKLSVDIWTIENLLYLVKSYSSKSKLAAHSAVSLDGVTPQIPQLLSDDKNAEKTKIANQKKVSQQENQQIDKLIEKLKLGKFPKSRDYEKTCTAALKILFENQLTLWSDQKRSNDNLFIFDTVCKIRDDIQSPFWRFLETFFNSKYIIFEYKDYSEEITQKEIFTTAKYLYAKAFRNVAIIFSANGNDKNSVKAARGVLREEGKLILLASSSDLIAMLEKKKDDEDPGNYLLDKLDNIMVELEK